MSEYKIGDILRTKDGAYLTIPKGTKVLITDPRYLEDEQYNDVFTIVLNEDYILTTASPKDVIIGEVVKIEGDY